MTTEQLDLIPPIKWQRLADYIECEGCIGVQKATGTKWKPKNHGMPLQLRVQIVNTDARMVQWLHEVFGGKLYMFRRKNTKAHWLQPYTWLVHSQYAVELLKRCRPFMLFKQEQVDLAVAFQDTVRPEFRNCKGVPEEIWQERQRIYDELKAVKRRPATMEI